MPHNGFIYEARMDMMENSGHCLKVELHVPELELKNVYNDVDCI